MLGLIALCTVDMYIVVLPSASASLTIVPLPSLLHTRSTVSVSCSRSSPPSHCVSRPLLHKCSYWTEQTEQMLRSGTQLHFILRPHSHMRRTARLHANHGRPHT